MGSQNLQKVSLVKGRTFANPMAHSHPKCMGVTTPPPPSHPGSLCQPYNDTKVGKGHVTYFSFLVRQIRNSSLKSGKTQVISFISEVAALHNLQTFFISKCISVFDNYHLTHSNFYFHCS